MSVFAYIHARPNTLDASGVFYVGKGREARVRRVARVNKAHTAIVIKYGVANILTGALECSSDEVAFALEIRSKISASGRGLKRSEATKRAISLALTGRERSQDHARAISAAVKGRAVVNNGVEERRVKAEHLPNFLAAGWSRGFLPFTCPHCGKNGGKSPMLARHVPECKGGS